MKFKRTHTCGELRRDHSGQEVVLAGWVHRWRDHGGLVFIDLRDRYGLTQVVFHPDRGEHLHEQSRQLRSEYVVAVKGLVQVRPEGTVNPKMPTGEIEVAVADLELLNTALTPPFEVADDAEAAPELRMKYRYVDLRRPRMQHNLRSRHRTAKLIRDYLDHEGFLEIETPMLTKSTPEGARDYLVPSRLHPGSFYALPQSPQLFKQILMVGGCDKYAQIVRCFRDEDLRGNRQPEFTQLDLEMSFIDEEDVFRLCEGLMRLLFQDLLGRDLALPLPRMTYDDALRRFGSDKPDLRFAMEIIDLSDLIAAFSREPKASAFRVFTDTVSSGGCVRGLCVRGAAEKKSRKDLDELTAFVAQFGAKGLAWFKVAAAPGAAAAGGSHAAGSSAGHGSPAGFILASPIAKFFGPAQQKAIIERMGAKDGDLLLFVADQEAVAAACLGPLRVRLGHELDLIRKDVFSLHWMVDFPLFGWDPEAKRLDPMHHPFTSPSLADLDRLETAPLKVKARAYDLVLNGEEIGGGSIRIHQEALQERIFRLIGITPQEAEVRFGFFLEALKYGAPPHGGIAFGLDRLVALFCGEEAIREVIPFPKTQRAVCQLTGAPTPVDEAQLKELGLRLL